MMISCADCNVSYEDDNHLKTCPHKEFDKEKARADMARINGYFGENWDVPAIEGKQPLPTPVGVDCMWCVTPIVQGDRGTWMPCVKEDNSYEVLPIHRECSLRMGVGGLSHLKGECSCYGGDDHDDGMTARESALAVWDYFQKLHSAGMN